MKCFPIGGIGAAIAGIGMLFGAYSAAPPAFGQVGVGQAGVGQAIPGVAGLWLDTDGKAAIEVKGCGTELCGNIVWLRQPLDPKGKPWTDILNPDTGKRGRPVCGLQIIGGLKHDGKGQWQDGWIYDPEEGKNFNVELSLSNTNTLKVFGYAGIKLLSETMLWKRLPGDSARCKA